MRATYVFGGWRPEVMHVASLAWGVLCAGLVLVLARRATGSIGWALLAAVVFLSHPNNFLTPRWVACQNEQMATAFTLAALLFYGRYSGWWDPEARGSAANLAAVVACYVAALGCRESAIILPALLLVGDVMRGGHFRAGFCEPGEPTTPARHRLLSGVAVLSLLPYALFASIAIAYLLVRRHMLGPLTIPGRPYAWPAHEPGFLAFIADKFVYYILGLWAYIPIVGFAGQEQMHDHPAIFYGLFAAIVVGWMVVLVWVRPHRRIWLWLTVALLPLAPVLPVFASAHHLYLASAGMAVATVLALRAVLSWLANKQGVATKSLRVALIALVPLHVVAFIGANFVLDTGVAGLAAACQLPIRQTAQLGRPMQPGDKLFFINLPMLAFNCVPAIEEARGVAPLHGHVLTFAPEFVRMDRPAHVEQIDAHRLRVWLDEPAYFSGLIGSSILQGIGHSSPFQPGERFSTGDFTVEVTRATDAGIQEFVFTFNRPLNDPRYHFFLSSTVFDAYPLRFR
jgi:hypothetical protein